MCAVGRAAGKEPSLAIAVFEPTPGPHRIGAEVSGTKERKTHDKHAPETY